MIWWAPSERSVPSRATAHRAPRHDAGPDTATGDTRVPPHGVGGRRHRRRSLVYGITAGVSADRLLAGQLSWFTDRGWDVTLVTTPDSHAHAAAARESVALRAIPMSRPLRPLHDIRALVRWIVFLRKKRPFATNVSTPKAGLLGGIAATLTGVPKRIYVIRGLRAEGAHGPMAVLLWCMEWLAIRCATDVVVVSPSLARKLHQRRLLTAPALLIGQGSSNGVRVQQVIDTVARTNRLDLRAEVSIPRDAFVLGYIGRVTADKGVDTLIEACSRLQPQTPIHLLLIGSSDEGAPPLVADHQSAYVHAIPWVQDPWPFFATMDALCLPTKREGFPNVVLEAAAASVPTITTRATGAIDSVIDGTTGLLVAVGRADELATAIRTMCSNPVRKREMGLAAQRRVLEHFQPERIWEGLLSILDSTPNSDIRSI